MTEALLKLKAKDAEDVQVISAVLQDAIAPVCDMTYNADDKNFIMVVHRLRREAPTDMGLERICCAVNVRDVTSVQTHGIDLSQQGRMLDLLAVMQDDKALIFIFAGNAQIRLQPSNCSMFIEDFGEAWPAQCNPCHEEVSEVRLQETKSR